MKRNVYCYFENGILILLIIFGEMIFHKVYLEPYKMIDLFIFSIPIYNISLSFILKFFIFDCIVWSYSKNLFIKRRYYGFPYPEFLCLPFAFITIFNNAYIVGSMSYLLLYQKKIIEFIEIAKKSVLLYINGKLSFNIDYSVLLPAIPVVIAYIIGWILELYRMVKDKSNISKSKENDDKIIEMLWKRNVIMPGESEYRSDIAFRYRSAGVGICFIVTYRFIVLMNIRLSCSEIITILLGLITLFFCFEHQHFTKQMEEDTHFLYEAISHEFNAKDGIHWKDLINFQIMEMKRLTEKYKHSRIRNIRWLELYEHLVVNDSKSIYDSIMNWKDGIYSAEKAMEEIKPKILSIEKISVDCMQILPNSRKFSPMEVDLIDYLQREIPSMGIIYLKDDSYFGEEPVESYNTFVDIDDLKKILHTVKEYLMQLSNDEILCTARIVSNNWINIEFILSEVPLSKIHAIQRDINRVNALWEETHIIDYYDFPIELAIAKSYMMEIYGDLLMNLKNNRLKLILTFPPQNSSLIQQNNNTQKYGVDICKYFEEYTVQNNLYKSFHNSKRYFAVANNNLLKEIMEYFDIYSFRRIKNDQSVFITVKRENDMIYVSLIFLCEKDLFSIEKEIAETCRYWNTLNGLSSKYTSLSLLMIKNKMNELSGTVNIFIEGDYFHCDLIFKSYEPQDNKKI